MNTWNATTARNLLKRWRRRLRIDERWHIDLQIVSDLEGWGQVAYIADRWEARIQVNSILGLEELEHTIVHELLELQLWELSEGVAILEDVLLNPATQRILDRQRAAARNRFIESILPYLLYKEAS